MPDRYASLKQGLVGCWIPSVSGGGLLLPDLSGNGNNGALTNMGPEDWVSGQYGRALDFDGSNDVVGLGNILGFEYNQAFSISLWAKVRETKFHNFVSKQEPILTTGYSLGSSFSFPDRIVFDTSNLNSPAYRVTVRTSSNVIVNNTWQHVLARSVGSGLASGLSIYVNGDIAPVDVLFDTLGGRSIINTKPFNIGARDDGASANINGQLDDIRIYNRALTESEIRLLSSEPGIGFKPAKKLSRFSTRYTYKPPKAKVFEGVRVRDHDYASLRQGLVGAWCPSLPNGGSGNTLPDQSGRGNHGTLTNMGPEDWVSSGDGRALDFDGANDNIVASLRYYGTGLVCFWVKQDTDAASSALCFGSTASTTERFIIGLGNGFTGTLTNELVTVASVDSSAAVRIEGYTTATRTEVFDGRWHHIAIAQRAANASYEIYLDGVSRTTTVGSPELTLFGIGAPNSDLFILGAQRVNAALSDFFTGQLDDIRIYNRALSESEIRLLASRRGIGLQPSPTRFIAREKKTGLRRKILTGQT